MNVLIIDNYDSFTYNLYQTIGELLNKAAKTRLPDGFQVTVKRNDEISLAEAKALEPDRIIISPGPGSPDDDSYFGVCAEVIRTLGPTTPLLGVCLGMQGIAHIFGGTITRAALPMHGKTSPITHNGQGVFAKIPNHVDIMRYHSLMVEPASLPECLEITAITGEHPDSLLDSLQSLNPRLPEGAEIMGIAHKEWPIHGVQYHPESFATEGGEELIRNFFV